MQINQSSMAIAFAPSILSAKDKLDQMQPPVKFPRKFIILIKTNPFLRSITLGFLASSSLCLSIHLLTSPEAPSQSPHNSSKKTVSPVSNESSSLLSTLSTAITNIITLTAALGISCCLMPDKSKGKQTTGTRKQTSEPAPSFTSQTRTSNQSRVPMASQSRTALANTLITAFYQGTGREVSGNNITELWHLDDATKEDRHNYIQWLFPLSDPTLNNPDAPILTEDLISSMKSDPQILQNLEHSFIVMMNFYGFDYDKGSNTLKNASNFNYRTARWINSENHNFKRLTRILKSLKIFGLHHLADALMQKLQELNQTHSATFGKSTYHIWSRAASAH